MNTLRPDGAVRPFSKSGYEILDDGFERGVMVIWSVASTQPCRGDLLLIERSGRPYDVAVERVRQVSGGWIADCRVAPAVRREAKPTRRRRLTPEPRAKG